MTATEAKNIEVVRRYFDYDDAGDAELTGFPYTERRYLTP